MINIGNIAGNDTNHCNESRTLKEIIAANSPYATLNSYRTRIARQHGSEHRLRENLRRGARPLGRKAAHSVLEDSIVAWIAFHRFCQHIVL